MNQTLRDKIEEILITPFDTGEFNHKEVTDSIMSVIESDKTFSQNVSEQEQTFVLDQMKEKLK